MSTVILFGHGQYKLAPTNQKATCTLRFYGPFGAFLTRAVARAIINHQGQMAQGCTRRITGTAFNELQLHFPGPCQSFDDAVWAAGTLNTYITDIAPGYDVPNLTLLPDPDEAKHYTSLSSVRMVTTATSLADIQTEYTAEDTLIWAACADVGGKESADQESVILEPALANVVYPPNKKEIDNERRYQEERLKEKVLDVQKQQFEQKKKNTTSDGSGIPRELQVILLRDFKATDDLDDQAERLVPLMAQYDIVRVKLFRFLNEMGIKGVLSVTKPVSTDLQNRVL